MASHSAIYILQLWFAEMEGKDLLFTLRCQCSYNIICRGYKGAPGMLLVYTSSTLGKEAVESGILVIEANCTQDTQKKVDEPAVIVTEDTCTGQPERKLLRQWLCADASLLSPTKSHSIFGIRALHMTTRKGTRLIILQSTDSLSPLNVQEESPACIKGI